jgi:predicted nucleic acid-binding protein
MAGTRRESRAAPRRLILDSGAVIALARGDPRARAFLARALDLAAPIEIPVVVVAETVRGGPRDAPINRVLRSIGSVPEAREAHGRTAGRLLAMAGSAATIDALVVAHAVEAGGAHVLTGDREDLERLAAPHPEVWIHPL